MIEARDGRAALAAVLFGLAVHGCSGASGGEDAAFAAPPARAISFTQEGATDAAQDAGLTFEDSSQDGDALVLTGVRYPLDETTTVTAERLRVVRPGAAPGGALTADRIEASGIVIEEAAAPAEGAEGTASEPSRTHIAELTLDAPTYRDAPEPAPGASDEAERRALAATLDMVSFGGLAASGIGFEGVQAGGAAEDLSVRDLAVGGYEAGRLGRVRLTGIEVLTPGGGAELRAALAASPALARLASSPLGLMLTGGADRTTVDEIVWEGLDLSGPRAALAAGAWPGLEADDVVFGDMVIRGQTSFVGEAVAERGATTRIGDVRFRGAVPTGGVIETEGAVMDMTAYARSAGPAAADAVSLLEARGLDRIEGTSTARFDYDPEAGRLTATGEGDLGGFYGARMRLDVGGLARLGDAMLGLDPVEGPDPTKGGGADGTPAIGTLGGAVLNGLSLAITDEQLLDVGFELAALGSDQSAATLRQQAVGLVTLGALQGAAISPRVPDYAGAISAFLSEGGTLTIRMSPEGGLTSEDAQAAVAANPASLLDAADLTITRTP